MNTMWETALGWIWIVGTAVVTTLFVVAAVVACLVYALPMRLNIVVAIAAAVAVCMLVESRERPPMPPQRHDPHSS